MKRKPVLLEISECSMDTESKYFAIRKDDLTKSDIRTYYYSNSHKSLYYHDMFYEVVYIKLSDFHSIYKLIWEEYDDTKED